MKWISVLDELPDIDQKVLILIDVGENIEGGEYLGKGNLRR